MDINLNRSTGGMSTRYMYVGQSRRTGFLPSGANNETYFGFYDNSANWGGIAFYTDADGQDYTESRKTARKFDIQRASC